MYAGFPWLKCARSFANTKFPTFFINIKMIYVYDFAFRDVPNFGIATRKKAITVFVKIVFVEASL